MGNSLRWSFVLLVFMTAWQACGGDADLNKAEKVSIAAPVPDGTFECTVLIQTRPDRLYCYVKGQPFRVILQTPGSYALGEIIRAKGTLALSGQTEAIPTLLDSIVHRTGVTNIPTPIPVPPRKLVTDDLNFRRVLLRGRVEAHLWRNFIDRHLEVVVIRGEDGPLSVNVMDYSDAATKLPTGSEVEVIGLSFVEILVVMQGPQAQIDVRNLDECRVIKSPPWITPDVARHLPAVGVAVAVMGGVWVGHERRQIRRLKVAERTVRDLNADLERRICERTSELEGANQRLQKAEKNLLRTLAIEKELNRLKTRFVSMVSHELRNPLGIVLCSAEVLKNYFDSLGEREREGHLDAIHEASQRMSSLIEEVLVLGRLEVGRMQCTQAPLQLESLCRRVVTETSMAIRATHPIEVSVLGSVDQAQGDESLIRHILSNLLSNALKYSPPCSPVLLKIWRMDGDAVFVIKDHGIGIPDEDRLHVFDGFFRGTNAGAIGGSGIGLSIVRRCVELHEGRITFESHEGEGTRFEVHLPLFRSIRTAPCDTSILRE